MDAAALVRLIRPDRLRELTWQLVNIPSPTGHATACTTFYADHLRSLGLDVRLETGHWPNHPTAVGLLPGAGGPTLQFDGHTDHVPLEHPAPELYDDRVVARGAADMKGSLAAMAEVAAVFRDAGLTPPGDLMFTAHDLHEAPGGLGESITDLCRRGIHGDAAIVCEAAHDVLPLVGRGMAIFELHVRRAGEPAHEVTRAPNPIDTAHAVLAALYRRRDEMLDQPEEYVGPETIFIGQVHAGTFYNQIPTDVLLNGTWRFSPRKSFADVEQELAALLATIDRPDEITFDLHLFQVRPSFALDPAEPLVAAVRQGYLAVTGHDLPLSAGPAVCDTPILIREGGIPCIGHGPKGSGAHGSPEWMPIDELVRATAVYLHTLEAWWAGLRV